MLLCSLFHSLFGFNISPQKELYLSECQGKLFPNAFRFMIFERYICQISTCPCCPYYLAPLHFLLTSFSPDIRCHWAPLRGEQVNSAQLKILYLIVLLGGNVALRDLNWIWFDYFAVLQCAGWNGWWILHYTVILWLILGLHDMRKMCDMR